MAEQTEAGDGAPGQGAPPGGESPETIYRSVQRALQVDGQRFGERVREMRRQRGWTLKDLARYSGVPITTLSDLETGASRHPEPALTLTLAEAFGCPSPAAVLEPEAPRRRVVPPEVRRRAVGALSGEAQAVSDVRLDVLVEQLLRGVWRAQAAGEGRGSATQVTTLGVGLVLLSPRSGRGQRAPRRPQKRG